MRGEQSELLPFIKWFHYVQCYPLLHRQEPIINPQVPETPDYYRSPLPVKKADLLIVQLGILKNGPQRRPQLMKMLHHLVGKRVAYTFR